MGGGGAKLAHSKDLQAFTLAEVLITLAIIGVVAAMTIPTLTASYRKTVVETKLKKVYSVMNQAINMTIAENGDYQNWVKDCGPSGTPTCSTQEAIDWFNEYLGKNIKSVKIEPRTDDNGFLVHFSDGSILSVNKYLYDMRFYMNAKAYDNPVAEVNTFFFRFNPVKLAYQSERELMYHIGYGFEPYAWNWNGTKEGLVSGANANTNYGCRADAAYKSYCTKLIQLNGWTIPDDYPVKF